MNRLRQTAFAIALSLIPAAGMCTPAAVAAPTDSMTVEVALADTIVAQADTVVAADKNLPAPLFYGPDGKLMVSTDEGALTIDELIREYYNEATLNFSSDDESGPTWQMVAVVAICFGVPALVAIVALILILRFQRRKNRERHDIIEHAIDNNYPLPDAFYTRQPSYQGGEAAHWASSSADGTPQQQPAAMPRDVRKLTSAITLTAVGLALFIAFACGDNVAFGFFAGGIPMFLGIGRMIAYYCVPGYADMKTPPAGQMPYINNGPLYTMPQQPVQNYPGQPQAPYMPEQPQYGAGGMQPNGQPAYQAQNQPAAPATQWGTATQMPPVPPVPPVPQNNAGTNNQSQAYDADTDR